MRDVLDRFLTKYFKYALDAFLDKFTPYNSHSYFYIMFIKSSSLSSTAQSVDDTLMHINVDLLGIANIKFELEVYICLVNNTQRFSILINC